MKATPALPPFMILDPFLRAWLSEDIGRGDRTTQGILKSGFGSGQAEWIAKEAGVLAGVPVGIRVFELLNQDVSCSVLVGEGQLCQAGQVIARFSGPLDALLSGERVALNIVMHLSGIATLTRQYAEQIADLPAQLVDTRKTIPGMRLLEKYATCLGGAINHRFGLDDAVMIKDNHIRVAGGIAEAIARVCQCLPYPLSIEVETTTLAEVEVALQQGVDIIMLDNMPLEQMREAVQLIRQQDASVKIEASGNITLETIRKVAQTGVDYISSSAPITRASWLDLSMRLISRS